jgi:hypothetical protein
VARPMRRLVRLEHLKELVRTRGSGGLVGGRGFCLHRSAHGVRSVVRRELRGKVSRESGRLGRSGRREVLHGTEVRVLALYKSMVRNNIIKRIDPEQEVAVASTWKGVCRHTYLCGGFVRLELSDVDVLNNVYKQIFRDECLPRPVIRKMRHAPLRAAEVVENWRARTADRAWFTWFTDTRKTREKSQQSAQASRARGPETHCESENGRHGVRRTTSGGEEGKLARGRVAP